MSKRFSFPPEKKPIERLFDDQNGNAALSVPIKGFVSVDCSERSQRDELLVPATKTIFNPSGEIANDVRSVPSGVAISRRISTGCVIVRIAHALTARTARVASMAAIHANRSRWEVRPVLPTFSDTELSRASAISS